MKNVNNKLVQLIKNKDLTTLLFKGDFGLEKENVRVDGNGNLALTPHPEAFGDKLKNPYIKTDFSESQIEVVTPAFGSISEAYNFLGNLQDIVTMTLEGEYLWPQSNPPILPQDEEIPIAVYSEEGLADRKYREGLAKKYGRRKQMLSGIHFNVSFHEDLLRVLHKEFGEDTAYQEFKNRMYLKVTRNYLKYRWLLVYLTGASPVFHSSFGAKFNALSEKLADHSYYYQDLISLRNSKCGYKNEEDYIIDYDSLEGYINSIQGLIDAGKISSASEFYSSIRLKGNKDGSQKSNLEQLKAGGIKYLEVRLLDLNPFCKNGVTCEELYLINLFLVFFLLQEEPEFDRQQQEFANRNHDIATVAGGQAGAKIYNEAGQLVSLSAAGLALVNALEELVQTLNVNVEYLRAILQEAKAKLLDSRQTYANRIVQAVNESSFIEFHMEQARKFAEASSRNVNLIGYGDLELSTQILLKDAIRRGVSVEIVDREENFLRLQRGEQVEYVKQATKTSKDTYSTVLVMENKVVTKLVLQEHGVVVPTGEIFNDLKDAVRSYEKFLGQQIVIKPKSTNFGLGISIFKDGFTLDQYRKALDIAFSNDTTVLVEQFVSGKEYRFLVIDKEVVGVLHRVPANVLGDGKKSIRQLVEEKNEHPLRGTGYKKPLQKLTLGDIEEQFLHNQGKDFDYTPEVGEVVFLRENSNISTGGDSIDYTDQIHETYKAMAIKSAQAVGAVITGVDMMIEDVNKPLTEDNYAIIELNFNPAIHIHCYPYQGKNRRAGEKILDLLFS